MTAKAATTVEPRWRRLVVWLAGGSSLFYLLSRFLPTAPPVAHGEIEDSYMQALHVAFEAGWQFGRDFIFTFGPWGFIYSGYHPATHVLAAIIWLGLALVFWGVTWLAARRFWANPFVGWLWVMGVAAVAGLPIFMMIDVGLKGFVVLFWLWAFFLDDQRFSLPQAVVAVCLGLLSLVKFSVFVDSSAILALASLDGVIRQRRFPWNLLVFGGSVVVFWLAARQHLSLLGPFLRQSWSLASGFSESMMCTGPWEGLDICLFLAVAALICAVAGWYAWARRGRFAVFALAGLGFLLFTAFKYGYVRHDGHEVAATLQMLLVSMMLPALARTAAQPGTWLTRVLSWLPTVLALGLAATTFGRYHSSGLHSHLLATLAPREVAAPFTLLRSQEGLRVAYQEYLAGQRTGHPLGPLRGTVDTYPGNAAALLAHGLSYQPRPLMQSYEAYTPEFAELNASFLRGPRAPDSIYFQVIPIDDHFPALDDGLSWPELLTRYEVRDVSWSGVVLQHSSAPRSWRLVPLSELTAQFGEVVSMPVLTNVALWVKLDLSRTLAGWAASTFYKPPILRLTVWTRGGQEIRYRLVPGMAKGGFVLSPLVQDSVAFALLASTSGARELFNKQLTALSLSAETESGATICYASPVRLELFGLDWPAQDLSGVAGFSGLASLWQALGRLVWLNADYAPQLASLPGIGSVIRVAPRSAMQLPLAGRTARLRLGFGLWPGEAVGSAATGSFRFRVSRLGEGGRREEIWSRQLEVSGQAPGQAPNSAVVELGKLEAADLILETESALSAPAGGPACYWSQIEPE